METPAGNSATRPVIRTRAAPDLERMSRAAWRTVRDAYNLAAHTDAVETLLASERP